MLDNGLLYLLLACLLGLALVFDIGRRRIPNWLVAGVRQLARKNAEFCPISNVVMRVCGVFFAKVVWGHA